MKHKKKYRPHGIQTQLLYRLFMILAIMLTLLGIYQYSNMRDYLYRSKVELLDSRFKNVNKEVVLSTNTEELLIQNKGYILYQISGEAIGVALINREGEVIATKNSYRGIMTDTSKPNTSKVELPQLNKEKYLQVMTDERLSSGYQVVKDASGNRQIVILREIGIFNDPSGLVQISTYIQDVDKILVEQLRLYIFSALVVFIVGGLLAHAALKHTFKPLKRMTNQLDQIDSEQLNIRVDSENGQRELDILANKFNSMFERLEKSFNKERQVNEAMKHFILDVSHELRTPLTSIQGFIEVLQLGAAKNKEQLDMALDSILSESQRLSKLVNQLLLLVKLEGNPSVELKAENMNSIIEQLRPQLEILMKNRKLEIQAAEKIYCWVNKDQVKQVIYNLVQNAINHTDEMAGKVKITLRRVYKEEKSWAEISVEDNGEGIPEEDRALIFERFYRVDKHRSRKNGGYGLGLSIVEQIIANHGGKIEVKSKKERGSTFSFLIQEYTDFE